MQLAEIQKQIDDWIGLFEEGYFPPLSNLARLMEEVGELSRAMNHQFGGKKRKEGEGEGDIADELGDILFTVAVLANSLEIDLSSVMTATLEKVIHRDSTRWTIKEGVEVEDALSLAPQNRAKQAGMSERD